MNPTNNEPSNAPKVEPPQPRLETPSTEYELSAPKPKKSKRGLVISLIAIVTLVVIGGAGAAGYYFFTQDDQNDTKTIVSAEKDETPTNPAFDVDAISKILTESATEESTTSDSNTDEILDDIDQSVSRIGDSINENDFE
jgi:cytoskeletal protein RodZ